ncbi:ABC transporter substrate-binding protein [Pseudoroseicyclus aestuarii]|uniref:Peptide/nickel transport system substrate-binding protein n=1 Tax=Pseudoroseicyclus aestuarii TaxID=1795041 RepID=A0A318SUK6_9RHOB|nr:peptide ABC transporter substrate-binding protein [Pseudoroseicyclus aestuarii]PYE82480.1 peptide/nickel transport system substrate-binding protein [Pseudoroseicyclus aestuarii]
MTRFTRRGMFRATVAGAALTVLSTGWAAAQQSGGTLDVGLTYEIDTMNVYSTGYLGDAQATIVEGLLAPDKDANYVPVLATEVPTLDNGGIELSEDGETMTITYHLREGVTWHDGEPFTSADVAFTWEAVKDPAFIAESKSGTETIDSIETPDDHTVIVHYNTVAPDFASTLFTFGVMPKHVLEGVDLNTAEYNELPIGTGPFMATEFERGQYVVAERNPDYWRTAEDGTQLPYLDRIVFHIVPDSNTVMTQLRSGELDLVVKTPYNQAAQIEAMDGLELVVGPLLSWQHLDFNFRNAMLDDLAVRQAVAHAIDREVLIRAQGGFPEAIKSIVVPVFSMYDDTTPELAYDVDMANQLLDEAGYEMGDDGIRTKDGERMSFEFVVTAGNADDENIQQILMAQLKEIGIELVPDNRAGVAYREARYSGDYDMIYGRWITSADPVYSVFYGTGGANNGQDYSDPALDEVLATLESSLDPEIRQEASSTMQHMIAEDLPSIPLTTNVALITKTTALKNFVPNPTNMTNFVNTADWYLEE